MKSFFTLYLILIITFTSAQNRSGSDDQLSLPDITNSKYSSIGSRIFHLQSNSRKNPAPFETAERSLIIQTWYPSEEGSHEQLNYINNELFYEFLGSATTERLKQVKTGVSINSPIKKYGSKYPVVLFSPGFGMSRYYYTFMMKLFASRGYFVVSIDHPYLNKTVVNGVAIDSSNGPFDGFPATAPAENLESGKIQLEEVYSYLKDDIKQVLDFLKTNAELVEFIDLDRVAHIGHSAGAMATKGCIASGQLPIHAYATVDVRLDKEWLGPETYIDIPNNTSAPILMLGLEYVNQFEPVPNSNYLSNMEGLLEIHLMKDVGHSAISEFDYLYYTKNNMEKESAKAKKDLLVLMGIVDSFLSRHIGE